MPSYVLKGMQQLKSCSFVLKHRITVVYQQHGKSDLASGSSEKHVHCWGHHDIPHCERELVKDLACLIKHDKIDFVIHSVVYVYAHLVVNLILWLFSRLSGVAEHSWLQKHKKQQEWKSKNCSKCSRNQVVMEKIQRTCRMIN